MKRKALRGFTLTELLVVITLIVAMLMILLPALQAFQQGRVERAANVQLVSDLNYARHQAMLNAAPVYMVFFPKYSDLYGMIEEDNKTERWKKIHSNKDNELRLKKLEVHLGGSILPNRLLSGQLTSYAIYAETTAGDQPTYSGSPKEFKNKVYLKAWKRLPPGTHFTSLQLWKLHRLNQWVEENSGGQSGGKFPFPRPRGVDMEYGISTALNNDDWDLSLDLPLPYIGFGPRGQLLGVHSGLMTKNSVGKPDLDKSGDGFFSIEIATGTVLPPPKVDPPNLTVPYTLDDADAEEERKGFSKYNRVRLNMLTGRSDSNVCNVYLTMKYPNTGEPIEDVLPASIMTDRVKKVFMDMRTKYDFKQARDEQLIKYRLEKHHSPLLLEAVSVEKAQMFENLLFAELQGWLADPEVLEKDKKPIIELTDKRWRDQLKFD